MLFREIRTHEKITDRYEERARRFDFDKRVAPVKDTRTEEEKRVAEAEAFKMLFMED